MQASYVIYESWKTERVYVEAHVSSSLLSWAGLLICGLGLGVKRSNSYKWKPALSDSFDSCSCSRRFAFCWLGFWAAAADAEGFGFSSSSSSQAQICYLPFTDCCQVLKMALQTTTALPYLFSSPKPNNKFFMLLSLPPHSQQTQANHNRVWMNTAASVPTHVHSFNFTRLYASKTYSQQEGDSDDDDDDDEPSSGNKDDPYFMGSQERREWRNTIRRVLDTNPAVEEELDPSERTKKVQQLLANYPLVVEEEDPEWPEDADGRGFKLDQFFDKITIKNTPKKDDDENDDSDSEVVWQDDNYIRPIKDVSTAEWEESVFKDISPLIILVHNRYRRPKENEKIRNELEKAIHIIWNCRLPSPRCIAVDAVTEHDLVSALQVSAFPEIIFTKAGKILYREKEIRSGDELSKVMAFFYYGAARPPCLNGIGDRQEAIPYVPVSSQP